MELWSEWTRCIGKLRSACSRDATFMWMSVILVAWAVRPDLLGVSSFVRASFLQENCYPLLLHLFHSKALSLSRLLSAWISLAMSLFQPVKEDGYVVWIADGLKVAKEGRKMPSVKSLHQESVDNSKPEYIMGHSFQVVSLLVTAATGQVVAVPILARICEGLVWNRRRPKSLLVKLADMFLEVTILAGVPSVLVADAYYASGVVIIPLIANGHHLVTRVRNNAVAYEAPANHRRGRGRPKKYGRKRHLRDLFKTDCFQTVSSPVYGETNVTIEFRYIDLLWRPAGRVVRFVLVKHPTRGKLILMSTDLQMEAMTVIKLYGYRFKIEVSFKQAIHTLAVYGYHFWMQPMTRITRGSGNQNLTQRTDKYKAAVARKMNAYHRFVQIGCIAHGLLIHLAINCRQAVWTNLRSWLRTMKPDFVPSELVVTLALKSRFQEFLMHSSVDPKLTKFILDRAAADRLPGVVMAA
jgi:hypothetical protein